MHVVDQSATPVRERELWLVGKVLTPCGDRPTRYFQFEERDWAIAAISTDRNGSAEFVDVPPGRWWVGPARQDLGSELDEEISPLAQVVDIVEGTRDQELELRAWRGLFLRGRIVDDAGAPVSRAFVGCESESICAYLTGDVQSDGGFELGPVAGGAHDVRGIPHGRYIPPEPVRAEAGGAPIVIVLERGGTLSIHAVDANGATPEIVDLVCCREGDSDPILASSDADSELTGLAPGLYSVVARTRDGRAGLATGARVASKAARTEVHIDLRPAARISVQFSGVPESSTLRVLVDGALAATSTLSRSTAAWEYEFPVGHVVAELSIDGTAPIVREVDARAGETAVLAFELD